MTINVTLNPIVNLQDTTTAQTTLNNNNVAVAGGFTTSLNVTGDQMKGNLDMNSNQILNLPSPATAQSPVRLMDVTSSSSIASVPPVGTSGAVVPLLNGSNTWSGINTFGVITGTNLPLTNINNTWSGTNSFGAATASTFTATTETVGSLTVTGPISIGSLSGSTASIRWRLPGISPGQNTYTWYVDGTNGNDANNGLAPGTGAFQTVQHAVDFISSNIDANQQNIVVQVNDATAQTTTLNLKAVVGFYDFWPNSSLLIQGNLSSPVVWNSGGNTTIHSLAVQGWRIQGFAFTNSNSLVYSSEVGGHIYVGANTYNGTCSPCIYSPVYGGMIEIIGTQTINVTSMSSLVYAVFGGEIIMPAISVVLNNTVVFSAFMNADALGQIIAPGTVYTGSGAALSSGTTAFVTHGAYLNTGGFPTGTGGGVNLVGNVAATVTTGWIV